MKKYHYDYVRVALTPQDRAQLEAMVAAGEAPSVPAALRKKARIYERTTQGVLTEALGELTATSRALRDLLLRLPRTDEAALYEADIVAMRNSVQLMERSMVSALRIVRRWDDGDI